MIGHGGIIHRAFASLVKSKVSVIIEPVSPLSPGRCRAKRSLPFGPRQSSGSRGSTLLGTEGLVALTALIGDCTRVVPNMRKCSA
jgi:hypothetical protein